MDKTEKTTKFNQEAKIDCYINNYNDSTGELKRKYPQLNGLKLDLVGEEITQNQSKIKQAKSKDKQSRSKTTTKVVVLASSLFIFVISSIFFIKNFEIVSKEKITIEDIINKYSPKLDVVINHGPTLIQANNLFKEKNFLAASKKFEESKDSSEYTFFHLGRCYIETSQFEKASKCYKQVLEHGDSFKEEAEFLYCMTLLRFQTQEDVIPLLQDISNRKNAYYKERAKDVIKDLYNISE